jgi:cytochrome c oxidase assembly protein subunit 15
MTSRAFLRFRRAVTVAFVLCFAVVLAGATVRATGSGMGCPDWPLCYGCWIPPVSAQQLPHDFEQKYAVDGHPATFDAVKTWIEYINRLAGVAAGISLLVAAVFAVFVVRHRPSLGWLSAAALLAVAAVAWLGAQVVGSFLAAHAVTLHLLAAYLLLGILLAEREIASRAVTGARPRVRLAVAVALAVVGLAFLAQWALGIEIRQYFEAAIWKQTYDPLPLPADPYALHKISGVVVGLSTAWLVWLGWRSRATDPRLARLTLWCGVFVVLQAAVGLVLWFAQLPPEAKPFHLAFATAAWSAWFATIMHSLPRLRRV